MTSRCLRFVGAGHNIADFFTSVFAARNDIVCADALDEVCRACDSLDRATSECADAILVHSEAQQKLAAEKQAHAIEAVLLTTNYLGELAFGNGHYPEDATPVVGPGYMYYI